MTLHTIPAGRLLIRALANAQSALVGILHLPAEMSVVEGAAYLLLLGEKRASILAVPLDAGLPDELEGQGIDAALRAPIWFGTSLQGAVCVRFTAAFPDANAWTVYGAANLPISLASETDASGHAWADINGGLTTSIPAPADAYGETPAQMLTGHAVWPAPDGALHTLSQHNQSWRQHYYRMSQLMARCGAGDINQAELQAQLRADPHLNRIRTWGNHEPAYLRYLAALDAAGGLAPDAPRTAAQHEDHWALVEHCFIESQAVAAA